MADIVQRQIDHLRSFVTGERPDGLQWAWDYWDLRSEWIDAGLSGWDPLSAWFEQVGYVVDEFDDAPPPYRPGVYGPERCRELLAELLQQAEDLGLVEPAAPGSVSSAVAAGRGRPPGPGRTGARRRSARARRGWRPA